VVVMHGEQDPFISPQQLAAFKDNMQERGAGEQLGPRGCQGRLGVAGSLIARCERFMSDGTMAARAPSRAPSSSAVAPATFSDFCHSLPSPLFL
jgi:hypothetical protein